jgi:cytochrome P450
VVLSLAAANRDPDHTRDAERFDPARRPRSLTFGTGPRACPGSAHALSLAAGVLDAFGAAELRLAPQTITYERRPNLRVPTRLVLRREGQPVGSSRPDRT